MPLKKLGSLVGLIALCSAAIATPALAETTYPSTMVGGITVSVPGQITTRAQLDDYLLSASPKTITIDIATGAMISVKSGLTVELPSESPKISVGNSCTSSTSCLLSGQVPYAHYGFSGTGTKTGSWPYRRGFSTGSHTAGGYYSWKGSSVCFGPCTLGPGSQVVFEPGQTATGIKVINYT